MLNLSAKIFVSAFAALLLTVVSSWALADETNNIANPHRHGNSTSFVATLVSLVR